MALNFSNVKGILLPNSQNIKSASIGGVGKIWENTSSRYKIWTVNIDETNSNPETACTYADDAIGMVPGSSDWDTIFGYKPCLFINGAVSKYLNPNNYNQDINGNSVDITTLGNDVMIEFPKMGYKIAKNNDNVSLSITNNPNAQGFSYKPFSRDAIGDRDYFYYGAYLGYVDSNKVYSSSDKTPTGNLSRPTYRANASARGNGYSSIGFYQHEYLKVLYMLKYKNRNSQAAVGNGYVGGSAFQQTGITNTNGMCYGGSATTRVKLFGIEDMWGNMYQRLDGILTDDTLNCITIDLPKYFDDENSGIGHNNLGAIASIPSGGYIKSVEGKANLGFVPSSINGGSSSTYYTDHTFIKSSSGAIIGGTKGSGSSGSYSGIFLLNIDNPFTNAQAVAGSRLMFV